MPAHLKASEFWYDIKKENPALWGFLFLWWGLLGFKFGFAFFVALGDLCQLVIA